MDACEFKRTSQKHSTVESPRRPLVLADKNNGNGTTRRSRTREISSSNRSPTPVEASGPRRCPSPSVTRTSTTSAVSIRKRAISTERKRPSTPPSPPSSSPSTPVQDTSTELLLASRKAVGNRLPESLWPSTMRSLSVSFQSDTFSLPVSKREKPVSHALTDRTLRPSSNVAHKQSETLPTSRKPTSEKKRSPLKGMNSADQSENSRPIEGIHARLVEQHRWPSRAGGKLSSNALNRSTDLTDEASRISSLPQSGLAMPSLRRLPLEDMTKPLQKSASDLLGLMSSDEVGRPGIGACSVDDNSTLVHKPISSSSLERMKLAHPAVRSQSLPTPGSRPASPNKASVSSSSVSRGVSPSRARTLNTAPSRGPSPSWSRPSSPSRQSSNPISVLSFIADIGKGKKAANHVDDAHQLRLLYNRHLQWRFAYAQADAALHSQKEKAEKTLYTVWRTTSDLWDSVIEKRMELQQLRLKLKLYWVLNGQLAYLDEWASIERDHTDSLSQATKDLQSSTLRLPVTGGAWGDIQTVKAAVCSAVDVMQAIGSSICFILSQVEDMNCLVGELADVAAQERAMLDECEGLLASTAAMQEEDYSLRTHLIQLKEAWRNEQLIFGN